MHFLKKREYISNFKTQILYFIKIFHKYNLKIDSKWLFLNVCELKSSHLFINLSNNSFWPCSVGDRFHHTSNVTKKIKSVIAKAQQRHHRPRISHPSQAERIIQADLTWSNRNIQKLNIKYDIKNTWGMIV